jgi:Glycosyl transferases group 1
MQGAREVEVVANGYDETALTPVPAAARARARRQLGIADSAYVLAFVGGDWGPNHDALAWLVEHVMPALARDGYVLLAVGAVARRYTGRREPWLVARPATPDLAEVMAAADAGMNPVTSGGGSNVKVPAYLAMGLAVISTPFGLRGYAPLAAEVVAAPLDGTADALRARPLGWAARGAAAPAALAGYAWGSLGERLADALAARSLSHRKGAA